MGRDERTSLGRTEPWLRAIGMAVWAFVAVTHLDRAAHLWMLPLSIYALSILTLTARDRFPTWLNVGLLAVQTASVLALPRLGLVGFEGLLLSIVVVQVPLVLSLRAAVLWATAQVLVVLPVVAPFNSVQNMFELTGAYSTFSAFALLIHWLRQQERRARAELARSNASLLATRAMLVEGSRQAERLRISRELHDSLGHHLTALGLQLDLAHRQVEGKAREPVARAQAIAKESLGEVRKVVSEMQTEQGIDLIAALKALAAGIPAPRISIRAPETLPLGEGEASHALFRCVQEAITNSVKHAGAQNVWVDIDARTEGLVITVRDDGNGVREVARGRGLEGMTARITQLGGSAQFESSLGQGFSVHLKVPQQAVS